MDNLEIYEKVRTCPQAALKKISGGRLNGKSDINPMWRIKILTEQFGACGIGWRYEITRQWTENGANGEIAAFCNIDLYVKIDGEWSAAIPGTGGSMFIAKENKGPYTSDECYKMALTDAISVSCKALGVAADVYWDADVTKYDRVGKDNSPPPPPPKLVQATQKQLQDIAVLITETGADIGKICAYYHVNRIEELNEQQAKHCIAGLKKKDKK